MATTKVTTGGITDATIATADIADQAVTLAKLPHGTSSNDGKFLRANNGADPTFETITGTTINNNADNRVITGSGTANNLEAEPNLTFDNVNLKLTVGNPAIIQSSSSGGSLAIGGGNTNPGGQILFKGGNTDANIVFKAQAGTSTPAERMRIDSSGRLLIGHSTVTPVDNDANNPHFQFQGTGADDSRISIRHNSTTAGNAASIYLSRSKGTSNGSKTSVASGDALGNLIFMGADGTHDTRAAIIQASCDGTPGDNDMPGRLEFLTTPDGGLNPTERMRIDNNGRVGISHNLSGAADYNRLVVHNPHSGSSWLQLTSTASGNGINTDGLSIGLNTANTGHIWLRENADLVFATNGTKRMSILAGGGLAFNNDTAQANALDDYEEGTFTPTIKFGTTSATSYYQQHGRYTKIGRIVHIQLHISINNMGSGTGNAIIEHLPFSVGNTGFGYFAPMGIRGRVNSGSNNELSAYVNQNSTQLYLYRCNHNGFNVNTTMTHSNLMSQSEIDIMLTYTTS